MCCNSLVAVYKVVFSTDLLLDSEGIEFLISFQLVLANLCDFIRSCALSNLKYVIVFLSLFIVLVLLNSVCLLTQIYGDCDPLKKSVIE